LFMRHYISLDREEVNIAEILRHRSGGSELRKHQGATG
jgi:hypothetical protein